MTFSYPWSSSSSPYSTAPNTPGRYSPFPYPSTYSSSKRAPSPLSNRIPTPGSGRRDDATLTSPRYAAADRRPIPLSQIRLRSLSSTSDSDDDSFYDARSAGRSETSDVASNRGGSHYVRNVVDDVYGNLECLRDISPTRGRSPPKLFYPRAASRQRYPSQDWIQQHHFQNNNEPVHLVTSLPDLLEISGDEVSKRPAPRPRSAPRSPTSDTSEFEYFTLTDSSDDGFPHRPQYLPPKLDIPPRVSPPEKSNGSEPTLEPLPTSSEPSHTPQTAFDKLLKQTLTHLPPKPILLSYLYDLTPIFLQCLLITLLLPHLPLLSIIPRTLSHFLGTLPTYILLLTATISFHYNIISALKHLANESALGKEVLHLVMAFLAPYLAWVSFPYGFRFIQGAARVVPLNVGYAGVFVGMCWVTVLCAGVAMCGFAVTAWDLGSVARDGVVAVAGQAREEVGRQVGLAVLSLREGLRGEEGVGGGRKLNGGGRKKEMGEGGVEKEGYGEGIEMVDFAGRIGGGGADNGAVGAMGKNGTKANGTHGNGNGVPKASNGNGKAGPPSPGRFVFSGWTFTKFGSEIRRVTGRGGSKDA
ncbi:hypothetical protein HDV00_005290 [Rhizophlyctis rosea]|nr:hypothetical protein HDV00_005290 [Rhizophlyctis rosea]